MQEIFLITGPTWSHFPELGVEACGMGPTLGGMSASGFIWGVGKCVCLHEEENAGKERQGAGKQEAHS